jgi:hypothetical protein
MYINETIQKHSTNNTKHSKYKYSYYQNTQCKMNTLSTMVYLLHCQCIGIFILVIFSVSFFEVLGPLNFSLYHVVMLKGDILIAPFRQYCPLATGILVLLHWPVLVHVEWVIICVRSLLFTRKYPTPLHYITHFRCSGRKCSELQVAKLRKLMKHLSFLNK